ncbi:hypothetical protein BC829DRAFT_483069 [Chytridium lagenaria]|nr:hypothetical protein BC829DRAFT_483069 [Chytridium lagenaria]
MRAIAMEKATLNARRDAVASLESEVMKVKEREENQIHAEFHALALKRMEVHREAALLRAERLAVDAVKARTEAEVEAFETTRSTTEREVRQTVSIHDSVVHERQKAETFHLSTQKLLTDLDLARQKLKTESEELETQRSSLTTLRDKLLQDRIALAEERGKAVSLMKRAWEEKQDGQRDYTGTPGIAKANVHVYTPPLMKHPEESEYLRTVGSKLDRVIAGLRNNQVDLTDQKAYLTRRGRTVGRY